jgi:hypothetical protein
MALNIESLVQTMTAAIEPVLGAAWKEAQGYARTEAAKLAQTLVQIETARLDGKMTDDQARILIDMQKNATRSVLITLEAIGLLTAQNAINAALSAIRAPVNAALGFLLL